MQESDIIELQTRLAWQEDTLAALSEVVARQDQQISHLQQQVQALQNRLGAGEAGEPADRANERPPHY